MAAAFVIRPLRAAELERYKALRDRTLADFPEAFTSDAASERRKAAASYMQRLAADPPDAAHFTLAAWDGDLLLGATSCTREPRPKARHIASVSGMMVRRDQTGHGIGQALLEATIARARGASGIEMLTLSVTAGNTAAVRLYQRAGFVRYGSLPRAIQVDGRYHTKDLMVLVF